MVCLPYPVDSHHLRFDACGLEYIDFFATINIFQVLVEVRTRTETSNENNALDGVSSISIKSFEVKLLRWLRAFFP